MNCDVEYVDKLRKKKLGKAQNAKAKKTQMATKRRKM
jgi:hypothetical protein